MMHISDPPSLLMQDAHYIITFCAAPTKAIFLRVFPHSYFRPSECFNILFWPFSWGSLL